MSRAVFVGIGGVGRPSMQAIVARLADEGVISFADESMTVQLDTETGISRETLDQIEELVKGVKSLEEPMRVVVIDSLAALSIDLNRAIVSAGPAPVDGQSLSQLLDMYTATKLEAPSANRGKTQKTWQHWQDRKRRF